MTRVHHYDVESGHHEVVFECPNDHAYEAEHLAEKLQATCHHSTDVYYVTKDERNESCNSSIA
jgi:hypothetical protein